ncbi:uncharacterized protein LTHEOB_3510 [Lasiodiplodia theobromae]|uniref:uncharacterized protein n=1 Tax=Lasiodiplodia theobromae TaxID=45133 RepID=UPI0015C3D2FA|nr:uncharacterized protein LTHEOB_3510 [Lasiodiplodia theobromae]KAF4533897.1 hypothetical protein LTHEOB_3510 [Lasiodiplodia theobromae]
MAPTKRPPNTAASLERLKAEVQAKLEAGNLNRKFQRHGDAFNRSLLMNILLLFSYLDPMTLAELRDNWLQYLDQQRRLNATVHRMEGAAFFIITTNPLPTWNIKSSGAWLAKLESWAKEVLGPDGMTYTLVGFGTSWSDEDEATTPVLGAMKEVLERISIPLSMLTNDWMHKLLSACTRIVLPEAYRFEALGLRPLEWSSKEKAIMMSLDVPLDYVANLGSNDPAPVQAPFRYDFKMAIPSDTPDECADLEVDPFFSFNFSDEVYEHATDAQQALAKFIYAHCARYAMSQFEAIVLAQALMNQHTKKHSSLTFNKDVLNLPSPNILREYRTYMPDIFGGGEHSQDIREAISRYTSLVLDEHLKQQQKENRTAGLLMEGKVKAREQCAILQQRMSKMRTKLSNSVTTGMRSGLLKLVRGKSDSPEQLMKTRMENLEREVKARVDILEREVKDRLALLDYEPSEKVKQELKDFVKKP